MSPRRYPENYLTMEQHTAEWFLARVGFVTASRIADALAVKKNGEPTAKREGYKMDLVAELVTGSAVEHYVSPAMDWGITHEPMARAAYELSREVESDRIGFVLHPSIAGLGASPDGLIGDDGLLELKCPTTKTHLEYVLDGVAPEEYKPQMLCQMACTGRQWCDFVSYDPRMPSGLELFVVRFFRDAAAIEAMEQSVLGFIAQVKATRDKLHCAQHKAVARAVLPGPPRGDIPSPTWT